MAMYETTEFVLEIYILAQMREITEAWEVKTHNKLDQPITRPLPT